MRMILHKGGEIMTNKHKIIVRGNIHMPWSPTDNDLKALNNYYGNYMKAATKI